jgi:hypothetical protein
MGSKKCPLIHIARDVVMTKMELLFGIVKIADACIARIAMLIMEDARNAVEAV